MLRFPKSALDPYCDGKHLSLTQHGSHQVLDIILDDESGMNWFETDGVLNSLAQLRGSLLQGDYQLLYLAWQALVAPTIALASKPGRRNDSRRPKSRSSAMPKSCWQQAHRPAPPWR